MNVQIFYLKTIPHFFLNGTPFAENSAIIGMQFVNAVLFLRQSGADAQKIIQIVLEKVRLISRNVLNENIVIPATPDRNFLCFQSVCRAFSVLQRHSALLVWTRLFAGNLEQNAINFQYNAAKEDVLM